MLLKEVMGRPMMKQPGGGQFETFMELPSGEEVDVVVHWIPDPDDPDVGYRGAGVAIEYVETTDGEEVTEDQWPQYWEETVIEKISTEEGEKAQAAEEDWGDWEYERRRDDRLTGDR